MWGSSLSGDSLLHCIKKLLVFLKKKPPLIVDLILIKCLFYFLAKIIPYFKRQCKYMKWRRSFLSKVCYFSRKNKKIVYFLYLNTLVTI